MKKVHIIHLAFLAVVLILAAAAYFKYWNVATANGVPISRIDYIRAMEKQGGKQTLEYLIEEALILNEGKSKNVEVDQKFIDEEIGKVETQLTAQNQTLETALASSGMTKADLEKQIRIKKIISVLSAPKTEFSQTEIDEYLKTNKDILPKGKTATELKNLATEDLLNEASQSAVTKWLDDLLQSAKVVYK